MIILDVLHVTESQMDLYSAECFIPDPNAASIGHAFAWTDGGVFGYGKVIRKNKVHYCAVNIRRVERELGEIKLKEEDPRLDAFILDKPLVPPSSRYLSLTGDLKEYYPVYMDYLLGMYKVSPKYYSIDQTFEFKATYGNHLYPYMDGNKEYRHASPDAVFKFSKAGKFENHLAFCNGFACWPEIIEDRMYALEGAKLSANRRDTNRRWVMVDFTPVGGAQFIHLRSCKGNKREIIIDASVDLKDKYVLMVLDGRLMLPGTDFSIIGHHVIPKTRIYTAVNELDRKLARYEWNSWNSSILEAKNDRDLMKCTNSFFIIINNPNMQVVKHDALNTPILDVLNNRREAGPVTDIATIDFDGCARGLLFDQTTRSVYDYARDENSMTFYADQKLPVPSTWYISTARTHYNSLIKILQGKTDNSMSAKGVVVTRGNIYPNDTLVRPRFTILDFISRS